MVYKVIYLEQVEKDLKHVDKKIASKIIGRIEGYLSKDPEGLGKPLKGHFSGYWRYRWGDFRVIYTLSKNEVLIMVLRIGHRKDIYDHLQ